MWQNIIVFFIVALAGGLTLWRFYRNYTNKFSCCGGGCTCKGSCGSAGTSGSGGGGSGGGQLTKLDAAGKGGSCCCH